MGLPSDVKERPMSTDKTWRGRPGPRKLMETAGTNQGELE